MTRESAEERIQRLLKSWRDAAAKAREDDNDPLRVLRALADAEFTYRRMLDLFGDKDHLTRGAMVDMCRAGDRARALLAWPKVGR